MLGARHSAMHEAVARLFADAAGLGRAAGGDVRDLRGAWRDRHPCLARTQPMPARDRAQDGARGHAGNGRDAGSEGAAGAEDRGGARLGTGVRVVVARDRRGHDEPAAGRGPRGDAPIRVPRGRPDDLPLAPGAVRARRGALVPVRRSSGERGRRASRPSSASRPAADAPPTAPDRALRPSDVHAGERSIDCRRPRTRSSDLPENVCTREASLAFTRGTSGGQRAPPDRPIRVHPGHVWRSGPKDRGAHNRTPVLWTTRWDTVERPRSHGG